MLQNEPPPPIKRGRGRPKGWRRERAILLELKELGVTKPYVAKKLKEVFEKGGPKEKLLASKMYLAMTGDIKDERSGAANVFNAPVMVIVGASQARMKALREAIPQLTAEQQQAIDEQEDAQRLADFKAGKLGFISDNSKADLEKDWNQNGKETVLDVESRDAELPPEAEPEAG